jgi:hypothetical protein
MKLEYPIFDSLPNVNNARERFLAKLFTNRKAMEKANETTDKDLELFYVYGMSITYSGTC